MGLEAGGWRLEAWGWRLEAGGWRLEAGGLGWRLGAGGWRLEAGGWKVGTLGGSSNFAIVRGFRARRRVSRSAALQGCLTAAVCHAHLPCECGGPGTARSGTGDNASARRSRTTRRSTRTSAAGQGGRPDRPHRLLGVDRQRGLALANGHPGQRRLRAYRPTPMRGKRPTPGILRRTKPLENSAIWQAQPRSCACRGD